MRRPLQLLVPYAWTVRALGCAPAAAQVLPGDWRPEAAASAQPLLAPVDCAPGDTSCIEEHGTFGRDPYLRIVEAADGSLNLTSDGALHASVVRRPNRPKVYDVQIAGGGRAILTLNTRAASRRRPAPRSRARPTRPTSPTRSMCRCSRWNRRA